MLCCASQWQGAADSRGAAGSGGQPALLSQRHSDPQGDAQPDQDADCGADRLARQPHPVSSIAGSVMWGPELMIDSRAPFVFVLFKSLGRSSEERIRVFMLFVTVSSVQAIGEQALDGDSGMLVHTMTPAISLPLTSAVTHALTRKPQQDYYCWSALTLHDPYCLHCGISRRGLTLMMARTLRVNCSWCSRFCKTKKVYCEFCRLAMVNDYNVSTHSRGPSLPLCCCLHLVASTSELQTFQSYFYLSVLYCCRWTTTRSTTRTSTAITTRAGTLWCPTSRPSSSSAAENTNTRPD
jgi:hypothetical protein